MRYLCLIYLDGKQMAAMPEAEMNALNARHLELNDRLLDSGHFIEAEALETPAASTCIRVRTGGPLSRTGRTPRRKSRWPVSM